MPRLHLVIDANNLASTMFFAIANPMLVNDRPTNAIYGFLKMIVLLKEQFQATNLVFCFDSSTCLRKKILATYKERQEKKPENPWQDKVYLRRQIYDLKNVVLPSIGLKNVLSCEGYEADDLVAAAANHWLVKRAVIVSSDKDLYQCLESSRERVITQYNVGSKKEVTSGSFQETYGIRPEKWPYVKALMGDVSDNIPGVEGVGEKTAIKYVAGCLEKTTQAYQRITQSAEMVARNQLLVLLPYAGLKSPDIREDEDTDESWADVCADYKVNLRVLR